MIKVFQHSAHGWYICWEEREELDRIFEKLGVRSVKTHRGVVWINEGAPTVDVRPSGRDFIRGMDDKGRAYRMDSRAPGWFSPLASGYTGILWPESTSNAAFLAYSEVAALFSTYYSWLEEEE